MVDEDGEQSNGLSRDKQDNTDVRRNKAEDTKMNILSNIQSMMPGRSWDKNDLYLLSLVEWSITHREAIISERGWKRKHGGQEVFWNDNGEICLRRGMGTTYGEETLERMYALSYS